MSRAQGRGAVTVARSRPECRSATNDSCLIPAGNGVYFTEMSACDADEKNVTQVRMDAQIKDLRIDARTAAQGDVETLRALEYGLLARLLARSPDAETLGMAARLAGDASDLGRAHGALAEAARAAAPEAVAREHFDLFVGVGRGELLHYASYYLTGFLNERPLAAVRRDLRVLGLERAEGLHDSEDHVAILFDVMAALAAGQAGTASLDDRVFFQRHLEPWATRFFDDLAKAESARFYRAVAAVGAAFVSIESQAFELGEAMT